MKRILTILCLTALLVACDFGPKQSSAQFTSQKRKPYVEMYNYAKRIIDVVDGVTYHVYMSGSSDGSIRVINHTKEKLEIELLKQQIINSKK